MGAGKGEDDGDLPGYQLGRLLGEGSYAKVRQGDKDGKKYAVKIINKKKAARDFLVKFLPRELEVMQKLKHPNIIELAEIVNARDNSKVFIIMELAAHEDLLEYIKLHGRVEEPKCKLLFRQLIEALDYMHKFHKICHRDLKCENLLLDQMNNIKVSDFGFARIYGQELSKTYCGSAAYAAPEVLQGTPYSPEPYDVWSCGVILYIMTFRTMPFDDQNIRKMVQDQLNRRIFFGKKYKTSPEVQELIKKILEPDVKNRLRLDSIKTQPWMKDAKYVIFKRKEDKTDAGSDEAVGGNRNAGNNLPIGPQTPSFVRIPDSAISLRRTEEQTEFLPTTKSQRFEEENNDRTESQTYLETVDDVSYTSFSSNGPGVCFPLGPALHQQDQQQHIVDPIRDARFADLSAVAKAKLEPEIYNGSISDFLKGSEDNQQPKYTGLKHKPRYINSPNLARFRL